MKFPVLWLSFHASAQGATSLLVVDDYSVLPSINKVSIYNCFRLLKLFESPPGYKFLTDTGVCVFGLLTDKIFLRFLIRYGDRAPKSFLARIFCIVWILVGIIIIAIFTAIVTASLSASIQHHFTVHGSLVSSNR